MRSPIVFADCLAERTLSWFAGAEAGDDVSFGTAIAVNIGARGAYAFTRHVSLSSHKLGRAFFYLRRRAQASARPYYILGLSSLSSWAHLPHPDMGSPFRGVV